jgi:hypothetical protein
MKRLTLFVIALVLGLPSFVTGAQVLIPMDLTQTDHLKAYGLAYWCLEQGLTVEWLLNYRGGSFLAQGGSLVADEAMVRGIAFELPGDGEVSAIYAEIERENMETVLLEKAPSVAVYVPPNAQPWDDAVRLALEYADIPYETVYDEEVLAGMLDQYDWLHLHHEDFTGQYGKFYAAYATADWYQTQQALYEERAAQAGYSSVSEQKKDVAAQIREYVRGGGFLFAMCSATDSFDIALAGYGVDFVDVPFDGTPPEQNCQQKLDYSRCLAFENFKLITDPLVYEFSDIDMSNYAQIRGAEADYFTLFEFSAKYDPVPTMLTQDHVPVVDGFLGQTTSFNRALLQKHVVVLGESGPDEVKYIHGNLGRGTFTFLGGHDPEDYQHRVGDPPTRLSLHKDSPGYRLILNNVLFPAAEKKKLKT